MLAVSEQVRQNAIERLRIAPDKVRVLYNGVDLTRFHPRAERDVLRGALGAAPDDLVVLFAGRLVPQKRPEDFLALARTLSADDAPTRPKVHFWLAGDGVMRGELESHARAASVQVLGLRDDMPELLAAADVFVMTSTREGFSNGLLEAMASGLCVVATDVGGNAEAVRSGRDGIIIPVAQPAALVAAVRSLLDDEGQRDVFARAALERAAAFSVDVMARNLEALYEGSVRGP
jgi:glycosyltransferase involved in cell wall biosynthesis